MTHQSKWGFHSCNRATFLKLKKLNVALERAKRLVAAWVRWERKDPHNRIMRKKIRNSLGQVVGFQPPQPIPEPRFCSPFTEKYEEKSHWTKQGYSEKVVTLAKVRLVHDDVADEYRKARYPVASPDQVKLLTISVEEIDRLLSLVN